MRLKITSYCTINDNSCTLDGALYFEHQNNSESFSRGLFKHLDFKYPKFYKMDVLSKFGFLASEIIIKNNKNLSKYGENEVALLFANSNSSSLTDLKYQETIATEKPSPSPSLFVYTLPNILLGEIAIRNKWYGENMFFVLEDFDAEFLCQYTKILFEDEQTKACLIAWIDLKANKKEVIMLCVEKEIANEFENKKDFNLNNIQSLYKKA